MQVLSATLVILFIQVTVAKNYRDTNTFTSEESMKNMDPRSVLSLEDRLVNGLSKYMNGEETKELHEAFEELNDGVDFRFFNNLKNSVACTVCNVVGRLLINYRKIGGDRNLVGNAIKKLCIGAKLQSENVCNGVVDLNIDIFIYIIDHKPDLSTTKICNIIGQPFGCLKPSDEKPWTIKIPPRLNNTRRTLTSRKPKSTRIKILHFTDLHYDDLYAPGSNAICGEPLCCGSNQGFPSDTKKQAGFWGDYRDCDMPWHSIRNLMEQISKHDLDYVYYTGDIINHRVWATSIEKNRKSLQKVYAEMRRIFPKTPVFPILGNHEPNPLNEFSENITQYNLSTQWLYDLVAKEWSHWLPDSTMKTIRKGGFYTVLVRPGFRIIALNSNVCYTYNWWLLYDDKDPYGQLQWLADTLLEAEKNGEIVHILTHIPSGDDTCYQFWSKEFVRIINRFAPIISAQFCGHTHFSEFQFFYDQLNKNQLISITFNGGSFTSYVNVNPNYRIYDINPYTWMVENYDEWIYNLTEANLHGNHAIPKWYKMYSFQELFNIPKMSLENMRSFAKNLASNQLLLDTYFRTRVRDGDKSLLDGCDQECHEKNLCQMVTSQFGDSEVCTAHVETYKKYKANARNKQHPNRIMRFIQSIFSTFNINI